MKLSFEFDSKTYQIDLTKPLSIGIQLDFNGPQPNHFGVEKASGKTYESDGFVGATKRSGGCNVTVLQMIPHCNGTHTETVGHIVDDQVDVSNVAKEGMFLTVLISVECQPSKDAGETYRPDFEPNDQVVTKKSLDEAINKLGVEEFKKIDALVVRTKPNHKRKTSWAYTVFDQPPFFTVDAIKRINELGIKHLLVDTPSIDRMHDEGLLTNHHLFWNVPEKTHRLTADCQTDKTITEMVFVPDEIKDGRYLLNLQIAPFGSDAAPSRPILFAIKEK